MPSIALITGAQVRQGWKLGGFFRKLAMGGPPSWLSSDT